MLHYGELAELSFIYHQISEPCHEKTCFFCIWENKGRADQHLCFRYLYFLNPKFQAFCHLLWFKFDLFGNREDGFSYDVAYLSVLLNFSQNQCSGRTRSEEKNV